MKQTYTRQGHYQQVVPTADFKLQMGISHDEDDSLIESILLAAQHDVEDYLGETLLRTTWRCTQEEFEERILLKRGPVQSITSVKYYDSSNAQQTVDSADYFLSEDNGDAVIVFPGTLPTTYDRPDAVEITFVAGVDNLSLLRDKRGAEAIKKVAASLYEDPLDESMPMGQTMLVERFLFKKRRKFF